MSLDYEKAQVIFHRNETLLHSLNIALEQVDGQLYKVERLSLKANSILQHEQWQPSLSSNPLWSSLRENLSEFHRLRAELAHKRLHLENQIITLRRQQEKLIQQSQRLLRIQQKLGRMRISDER